MLLQKILQYWNSRGLNRISPEINYLKDREIIERKKSFGTFRALLEKNRKIKNKEDRLSQRRIAEISGIARATYYRLKKKFNIKGSTLWKALERESRRPGHLRKSRIPENIKQRILELRLENPTQGKEKIRAILLREKTEEENVVSSSSIGRILKKLKEKGKIEKYSPSQTLKKRHRNFNNSYAKRWEYEKHCLGDSRLNIDLRPGELIEIDHLVATRNNIVMRQFSAIDPKTRLLVSELYSCATSSTAKKFLLEKVLKDFPFPITSIQVDGGSEFRKHFEEVCEELSIELFVLKPSSPKYNGRVERSNRIVREEFYARKDLLANSLGEFREELAKYLKKYNDYRPHSKLDFKTPMEYYFSIERVG
jgi:IS30 family transposase